MKNHSMTAEAFDTLVRELHKGNNEVLRLLQPFQAYCQKTLMIKSRNNCTIDESYDIFIDAILDFRKNVLHGKVKYQSIRAYLAQICWNKWMEKSRSKQRRLLKQQNVAQEFYHDRTSDSPEDKWLAKEASQHRSKISEQQLEKIQEAMQSLSEKCRRILQMAIVEKAPMAQIAQLLGLANANVAKTTKSRCYRQLMKKIQLASS